MTIVADQGDLHNFMACIINQEIFVYENVHVLNVHVNKIFVGIKLKHEVPYSRNVWWGESLANLANRP